jgi:hypothetical protein
MAHRRLLRVVQADVAEPVADQGFAISEYYFGGLLAQVGNRQHRYVTGTVVTAPDAAALADAIEKIELTPGCELARAINGDATGEGVTAFCDWLRLGAFEMVEGGENLDKKS